MSDTTETFSRNLQYAIAAASSEDPALLESPEFRTKQAELERAAADFDRAMDAICDAEATLDLLQTLVTVNNDMRIEIGTDSAHTPLNALRAMQRHLTRAREAMESGAG